MRVAPPNLLPVIAANRPARGTPGYITLGSAFLDPRLIPWDAILECFALAARDPGPATFAHVQGFPPLRAAIAQRLARIGIVVDPAHVLVTLGSQHALDLIARSLVERHVAVETPGYAAGRALFELAGATITPLPLDPFEGVDLARWHALLVARRPALAYLTTSTHNPTGYTYSAGERAQLVAWASELGFGILEDDWASEMRPAAPMPRLRALGGEGVLYTNAFTKKLVPSLRLGYIACDATSLPSLLQAKKLSLNGTPALVEEMLFHFLVRGHYDVHIATVEAECDARARHCLALLAALMPGDVRWTRPVDGPVLWLELPRRIALDALIARLAARKVLLNPQDTAFAGTPHLHGVMIGYGFPDRAEMTTALEILAELVR